MPSTIGLRVVGLRRPTSRRKDSEGAHYGARRREPWGHLVTGLVEALPEDATAPPEIIESANRLDKHYVPSRYPNGFAEGYPGKLYTRGEAEGGIADAEKIIAFCRRHLPR